MLSSKRLHLIVEGYKEATADELKEICLIIGGPNKYDLNNRHNMKNFLRRRHLWTPDVDPEVFEMAKNKAEWAAGRNEG